ncbi:MAG: MerR family transcriptional regulator [Novosphingobium sp.]|nr:MerR family transcriptional regulator [Novosphingobium sp.]
MAGQPTFPAFADGKEPEALRTIGEVAAALDIRQHVLRYWEEQFPMLRPIKRSGGRRYYRPEHVELVAAIHRLVHVEGYTLRGARLALESGESGQRMGEAAPQHSPQPQTAAAPSADHEALVARLRSIRSTLADALAGT